MANGEKDNQEETYRHRQSVQVRPCWTVATCTQDWLQQFLRGKNDVKNWFEFWQILPGICLGGVCTRIAWFVINSLQTGIVPKITWKNEWRQRKQENCWQQPEDRQRSSLQWWRWSALPMSNLQTARGLWPEEKTWKLEKSAKSKNDICELWESCEGLNEGIVSLPLTFWERKATCQETAQFGKCA